ncbi:MAG: glycosyltransferase family 4 protein [Actinomycetota bacterium]
MHVLYLIDSLSGGGAEQSLAALASPLVSSGMVLDVAYLKDTEGMQNRLKEAGANLYSLAQGGGSRRAWVKSTRALLERRRPDLLHTTLFESDIAGRIAAMRTEIPVVTSLVNVTYGPEQFADPRLKAWRLRGAQVVDLVTARRVARWHAISGHVADVMAGRLRIPRARIDVIPRGRDPQSLGVRSEERRACTRATLGIGDDQPLVLAAARQEHQKGLDVLIESWPEVLSTHPSARLLIAGREGNQSWLLNARLDETGTRSSIALLGSRADVSDLLCATDAFVMPSRWEGLGSVLLEAMALEAPIVASDLPAVREIVEHGRTATLVPREHPRALATAISDLLSDPGGARKRSAAARAEFLAFYTIDRIARQTADFYRCVAGAPAPS